MPTVTVSQMAHQNGDTSEYCPSSASSDESIGSDDEKINVSHSAPEEKKIIVFESQVDKLFKVFLLSTQYA